MEGDEHSTVLLAKVPKQRPNAGALDCSRQIQLQTGATTLPVLLPPRPRFRLPYIVGATSSCCGQATRLPYGRQNNPKSMDLTLKWDKRDGAHLLTRGSLVAPTIGSFDVICPVSRETNGATALPIARDPGHR